MHCLTSIHLPSCATARFMLCNTIKKKKNNSCNEISIT